MVRDAPLMADTVCISSILLAMGCLALLESVTIVMVVRLPDCQIVRLLDCQIVRLLDCHVI
jgi:hypothetical protein